MKLLVRRQATASSFFMQLHEPGQVMLPLMPWSLCFTSHFGNFDPKCRLVSFGTRQEEEKNKQQNAHPFPHSQYNGQKMRIFLILPTEIKLAFLLKMSEWLQLPVACKCHRGASCVMDVTAAVWRQVVRGWKGRMRLEKRGERYHLPSAHKARDGNKARLPPDAFISCAAGNCLRCPADSRRSYPACISQVFYY